MMRPAAAVAMLAVGGMLGFGLWYSRQHPRVVVATGTLAVANPRVGQPQSLTLATRDVEINGVRFREIELPGGTWIDCASDCPRVVRQAREEFWATQDQSRR